MSAREALIRIVTLIADRRTYLIVRDFDPAAWDVLGADRLVRILPTRWADVRKLAEDAVLIVPKTARETCVRAIEVARRWDGNDVAAQISYGVMEPWGRAVIRGGGRFLALYLYELVDKLGWIERTVTLHRPERGVSWDIFFVRDAPLIITRRMEMGRAYYDYVSGGVAAEVREIYEAMGAIAAKLRLAELCPYFW